MHAWLQAAHIPSKLLAVLAIVQIQKQAHVTAAQIYLRRQLPCRALLLQECLEGISRLGCHACRRCAETPFGRPEHSLANLDARKKRKARCGPPIEDVQLRLLVGMHMGEKAT